MIKGLTHEKFGNIIRLHQINLIYQEGEKVKNEISIIDLSNEKLFEVYEQKFKALADQKRLQIMNVLTQKGEMCVCDLAPIVDMTQSKLSYHLKILLDANIISKETRGTWSYYKLNTDELNHLLSEELCCLFKPNSIC